MDDPTPLSAATIVGLLADDDRRRVFAAITLGHSTIADIAVVAALSPPQASKALGKLVTAGLVESRVGDGFAIDVAAWQRSACDALARPRDEHANALPSDRAVLGSAVRDGRIVQMPTARAKVRIVLDWVAQLFEPGRRYPERDVNEILVARFADYAALRRALVDEELLDREAGEYWRIGGSVS